jgi:hypothetical protein
VETPKYPALVSTWQVSKHEMIGIKVILLSCLIEGMKNGGRLSFKRNYQAKTWSNSTNTTNNPTHKPPASTSPQPQVKNPNQRSQTDPVQNHENLNKHNHFSLNPSLKSNPINPTGPPSLLKTKTWKNQQEYPSETTRESTNHGFSSARRYDLRI